MTRKRTWIAAAVVVALSTVGEIAFRHSAHPVFIWHHMPLFDFVYGVAGCVALVLVAKWLGKTFIQRDVKYYDDEASS
jgi:hypothetical protein